MKAFFEFSAILLAGVIFVYAMVSTVTYVDDLHDEVMRRLDAHSRLLEGIDRKLIELKGTK